jgi:hypothetical protein
VQKHAQTPPSKICAVRRVLGADMTLEDIGNIGELIAAFGVIVSLIFLGIQIKRNTKALYTANQDTSVSRSIDTIRFFASNPLFAALYQEGLQAYDQLNENDKFRFNLLLMSLTVDWYDQYTKYCDGQISEDVWSANLYNLKSTFSEPGAQQWLESPDAGFLSETFRSFVEEVTFESRA